MTKSSRVKTPEQMLRYLQENVYRDPGSDCLIWAGTHHVAGYPMIFWGGKLYSARRLYAKLKLGEAEFAKLSTKKIGTTCDRLDCMNFDHFVFRAQWQVVRHAVKSGKFRTGTIASLRSAKSWEVRKEQPRMPYTEAGNVMRMIAEGKKTREIAAHYGVVPDSVTYQLRSWRRMGLLQPLGMGVSQPSKEEA